MMEAVATTDEETKNQKPVETPQENVPIAPTPQVQAPSPPTDAALEMPTSSPNPVEEMGDDKNGMWNWIKSASQNSIVQKVMETTKHSVDKMITTLDPGMTPYLRQGGDISFVVTSEKEVKWTAVLEAMQAVFGIASVKGIPAQANIAPQPVGFASGIKGAQERIAFLRRSELVHVQQPCISIENFIAELLPDKWFDIGCIYLDDPVNKINLEMFTQAVPVPADVIERMETATPSDYPMRWSGLSVTVGQAIHQSMPWVLPEDWHKSLTGQSRKTLIYNAMLTIAGLYKDKLPKQSPSLDI